MTIDQAIQLVKKAVKFTGTIDQKHIDLTTIAAEQRPQVERALAVLGMAVQQGQMTKDDLNHRLHLDY